MAGRPGGVAGPAALRLTGVRKRFPGSGRWVLDGVHFAVGPGTMTVITGGNGTGKSTLLRIAAGATIATRGRVCRPAGQAAYVPERLPGQLRMTADQYLAHMGRMRGLASAAAAERGRALLGRLALAPGPGVPIGTLSRGNAQKVALAQALLAPVGLLVLDEPHGGLDDGAVAAATALVDEAVAGGATVLLAVPEPDEAHRADAHYLLMDGRLVPQQAGRALAAGPDAGAAPEDSAAPVGPGRAPQPAGAPREASARQAGGALRAEERLPPDGGQPGRAGLAADYCVTNLVLEAVRPGASAELVTQTPGVLSWDHDAARGLLEVRTSDGDAVLRRALGSGWSFRHGSREAQGGPGAAP
jgi:ABC-2 type transport system ATP-binding protein